MNGYKISKLQTHNYRNLQNQILAFSDGVNCILGENGNGKTNILEAIYYLASRKSFRKNTSFPQILSMDGEEPEIIISSTFSFNEEEISYSGKITNKNHQWYLNGKPQKKRPDFKIVFINPFDSYNFHNNSTFRRSWLDTHLSQINTHYKQVLNRYNQCLKFRNKLLSKKPSAYLEQVKANDKNMIDLIPEITLMRVEFLADIQSVLGKTFHELFSEEHKLELQLKSDFLDYSKRQIEEAYALSLPKDSVIGYTTKGIHKDDYIFNFDGINSYEFCSLGQQKMSYLGLQFAYIELFRYKLLAYPIVLIDDISGELDRKRWKNLINFLDQKNYQVVLTTANEDFKNELDKVKDIKKFEIKTGEVFHLTC
jgi:DNA replication and repair protein RecF